MRKTAKIVLVHVVAWLWLACARSAIADMQIYYVHSDHLNTPQMLTDKNQNVVWAVESQTPFGEVVVNEDVDGDGSSVEFNQRFPGQYFDKETGTNYNYYRTYDPSTGRYIQSDPIGLNGGINTYAYVLNNPLKYSDPYGLCPAGGLICGTGAVLIGTGLRWGASRLAARAAARAAAQQALSEAKEKGDRTPEEEALAQAEHV